LEQALELEPSPSRTFAKKVVIDGTEYSSMRQAAKELGVAQSTLMNRIKSGISVKDALSTEHTEREKLKGQSKPMFYQGKLYPSARHLLLVNPALVAGGDMDSTVTKLNDRARRAKNRGEIENLSIDKVSVRYRDDQRFSFSVITVSALGIFWVEFGLSMRNGLFCRGYTHC
jgi:hypothetical protein